MSPITHFIGSWLVAVTTSDNPRDRRLVTLAGVIPDLDGLGIVADWAKSLLSGEPASYAFYQQYHHVLLHGWPAALVIAAALSCFARQRRKVLLLCLLTFHVHLLCDLVGSRGASPADLWPISYGEPLFRHPIWFWRGQWKLDGWQNQSIFLGLFALTLWLALKQGFSVVQVFNRRADEVFVGVLRKWRDALVLHRSSSARDRAS